MLQALLRSFEQMQIGPNTEVVFAVVENGEEPSLSEMICEFQDNVLGSKVVYEVEPQLGIPTARNHVLEIAIREKMDFVGFVDDDETVDPEWLVQMLACIEGRGLDLVGGPVRLHPLDYPPTPMQRLIYRGLVARCSRIERRAALLRQEAQDHRVTIITSSWLGRCEFILSAGLRFDASLGFSGGSDTAIYRAALAEGAKTGWCPQALVYETMPPTRLTPGYQFGRAKDQAVAAYRRKFPRITWKLPARNLVFVSSKILSGFLLAAFSIFNRGASLTSSIRAFGFAYGTICAMLGHRSEHYRRVHGS
jgi:glycosyltransferase involved in cell wall biosynthesis